MKKAEFASLCAISPAMVTKYSRAGLVVMGEGGVDAPASLKALQGHLDERKRVAAIIAHADGKSAPAAIAPGASNQRETGDAAPAEAANAPAPKVATIEAARIVELERRSRELEAQLTDRTDRARREKIEADKAEVEFLQMTGRLVDANEVRKAIEDAVAMFWTELTRRERDDCSAIAADLNLDSRQATELRFLWRRRANAMRAEYAAALAKVATGDAPPRDLARPAFAAPGCGAVEIDGGRVKPTAQPQSESLRRVSDPATGDA